MFALAEWGYNMAEYSRLAKGSFTSTGAAKVINLPFQPDSVKLWNYTASAAFTDHRVLKAYWDVVMGQGFAMTDVKNTTYQTDSVIVNGVSTFSAGQLLQFGAVQQIVTSTKGSTTSFQVTGHGYVVGDVVLFEGLWQSATTGMQQMAGIPMRVTTVTDANNFIVTWDSNNAVYTNLSGSPVGAKVVKVLYPYLYLPGVTFINAITRGTTTTVTTTTDHNLVVGQEVAFRIPNLWGTTQLNSLPNTNIPGQPIYGYVVAVNSNSSVTVNINSSSYTAFTTYITVANVFGLTPAQMVAVGDVNTGGNLIDATSPLYPSPVFPTSSGGIRTINGPAIRGAFVNNTAQGFIIGAGVCVTDTAAVLVGAASDVIYWEATLHDISLP